MRYKPLAPVSEETRLARQPFVKFVSDTVDRHANEDEQLMKELENFAYMILTGIDGFYIQEDAEVDLVSRPTGIAISADLHAAFLHCRLGVYAKKQKEKKAIRKRRMLHDYQFSLSSHSSNSI